MGFNLAFKGLKAIGWLGVGWIYLAKDRSKL